MTGKSLRLAWILVAILPAGALAEALAIDLAEENPIGLERLPGIHPEEVAELASVSGLGPDDLGRRLCSTSIDPERLRSWGPYLELLGGPAAPPLSRARLQLNRDERGRGAADLTVRIEGDRLRWEGRARERVGGSVSPGGAHSELRLVARPAPDVEVAFGSLRGSLSGGDPWSDPLGGSRMAPTLSAGALLRASATAVGASARAGPLRATVWREPGRDGFLLWGGSAARAVWLGRSAGRGIGGGMIWTGRQALFHLRGAAPENGAPALRAGLVESSGRSWLFAGGALGPAGSKRSARIDAGGRGSVRGCRIAGAGTFDIVDGRRRTGGRLQVSRGPFPRAMAIDLRWEGRKRTGSAAATRPLGPGWGRIRLEGSDGADDRKGRATGSLGLRRAGTEAEIDLSLDAGGPAAAFRLGRRSGSARLWLDVAKLALRGGSRERERIRFGVEISGGG